MFDHAPLIVIDIKVHGYLQIYYSLLQLGALSCIRERYVWNDNYCVFTAVDLYSY